MNESGGGCEKERRRETEGEQSVKMRHENKGKEKI